MVVKNYAVKDQSAQLVGITDSLGDMPFGLVHRLSTLSFSNFKHCNFGRYGTASWNRSATRRLLLSITYLIFSFRAWHTGTLGKTKAIRRLAQWLRQSSGLLFFIFSAALFLFAL
ncbi:hypothetical protein H5410_015727 [Solanum commersonii]|uniref:Uncharacterized protein n=1 Tax=Solanum commersonii TaxID=4109 RepID=A0A9J5ZVD5_SOLCO|nr:hypothetical protein H5410_015727 [Solanum commersonii]